MPNCLSTKKQFEKSDKHVGVAQMEREIASISKNIGLLEEEIDKEGGEVVSEVVYTSYNNIFRSPIT